METSYNVVVLPGKLYSARRTTAFIDIVKEEECVLGKIHTMDSVNIIQDNDLIKSVITDPDKKAYVNLNVRKYLMVDCVTQSGKVQATNCDYHIMSHYDINEYGLMTIKNVFDMDSENFSTDAYIKYNEAVEQLVNLIDYDLITENDYVLMPYTVYGGYRSYGNYWDTVVNNDRERAIGYFCATDKTIFTLKQVLNYSKNKELSQQEMIKASKLLDSFESEKIALTILNTVNPTKSFIELSCVINYFIDNIKSRLNIPVLPLFYGAYGCDASEIRRADAIIKLYEKHFGPATKETMERMVDAYHNPRNEKSNIFDFKLKLK